MPLPDLTSLPRVTGQTAASREILEAVYYDTDAFDLLRAGVTLRRRQGGADAGWHLKVPEHGPGARAELRLPDAPQLPDEFADLVTARARGRELRPVAQITTTRHRVTLTGKNDHALAEVALDTVTAESFGHQTTLTRWNEVEIELAEGAVKGRRLLKEADRHLRRKGIRRSSRATKLHTAVAHALDAVGEDASATAANPRSMRDSAAAPVLAYLREQLEQLIVSDMAVRRDASDSIHQMRVATRRMRSALQAYRPLFQGDRVSQLISELRWIGQELGPARDEEVLAERLSTRVGEVAPELALGPVAARVQGHYAPRQADTRRALQEALHDARYVALLRGLDEFLADPPLAKRAKNAAEIPAQVRRAHRRVSRRMSRALREPPGPQRDAALHEARKAAKQARYAAEVAALCHGKKARRSARGYKKLQTVLGNHHDAVIAAGALRELALRAYAEGENTFTYGLLHQRELAEAARLAQEAPQAWKRASRPKSRAWMKGKA